jgi:ketosteroid isomerase-like protein
MSLRDTEHAAPRQNIEIVRRGIDAFNRRDVEGMVGLAGPNTEIIRVLESEPVRGPRAFRRWLADNFETMSEQRVELQDIRSVGDEVVLLCWVYFKGRASGVALDGPVGMVVAFAEGAVRSLRLFGGHRDALDAVGLAE